MDQSKNMVEESELTEMARVSYKDKCSKTVIRLMSDGSTWERHTRYLDNSKVRGDWNLINRVALTSHTCRTFIEIFGRGGWKVRHAKT